MEWLRDFICWSGWGDSGQWEAAGTWVAAVLAAGAAVYARRAWLAARDQADHAAKSVEVADKTHKDAQRPALVYQRARVWRSAGNAFVEVTIENVGPGPALDVEAHVYVCPLQDARANTDSSVRSAAVDEFRQAVAAGRANRGLVKTRALRPLAELRDVAIWGELPLYPEPSTAKFFCVIVLVTCQDLFDRRFDGVFEFAGDDQRYIASRFAEAIDAEPPIDLFRLI